MSNYDKMDVKSGGVFLKIQAGDPQDIRLLDDSPIEKFIHPQTNGKPIVCKSEETCDLCAQGDKRKQRLITNVFSHNEQRVMIFEFGPQIAKQIKAIAQALREEQMDIMEVDLKIDAKGSGIDTEYTVTPRRNSKTVPTGLKKHPIDIPF